MRLISAYSCTLYHDTGHAHTSCTHFNWIFGLMSSLRSNYALYGGTMPLTDTFSSEKKLSKESSKPAGTLDCLPVNIVGHHRHRWLYSFSTINIEKLEVGPGNKERSEAIDKKWIECVSQRHVTGCNWLIQADKPKAGIPDLIFRTIFIHIHVCLKFKQNTCKTIDKDCLHQHSGTNGKSFTTVLMHR